MPAITRKLKDLYLAGSVGELNIQANDKASMIKKMNGTPNMLLNSMEKIYKQARLDYDLGDEEKAYVLYMRVANVWDIVKKSPAFNVHTHGKMLQEAINRCEELSNSLEKRYKEAKAKSSQTTTGTLPMPGKTIKANNNNDVNSKNTTNNNLAKTSLNINNGFKDDLSFVNNSRRDDCSVNHIDGDSVINPSIEPLELYDLILELIKSKSEDVILLLDARKREDFEASHISNLRTDKVKVLNIPEELLEKGTAATKLIKSLPPIAQLILKERRTARKVIIFDWKSSSYNENGHLDALFAALWKFDNKEGCISPPILLKKGYYGWLNSYPTFTSNPNATLPVSDDSNDSDFDSISLNFYSQLNKSVDLPTDKPISKLNGSGHQSESINDVNGDDSGIGDDVGSVGVTNSENGELGMIQDSNELVIRLTNSKLKDNATKIPGSAQPVPPINRQVKPKLNNNEAISSPIKPLNNIIMDKPNGLTSTIPNQGSKTNITPSYLTNGPFKEHKNITELALKEELQRIRESEYERANREKEEMLKKVEAQNNLLLRENLDLKRKLKPNPSKSLDSSSTLTSTVTSPVQRRLNVKPVKFSVNGESGDEEIDSEGEKNVPISDEDEEMSSPSRKSNTETTAVTIKLSDERTVSESSTTTYNTPRPPLIAKTEKSLSRSYSSPNIADHYDDDDSQNRSSTNHPPTFDRTLKPLNNANDFPRSFASSASSASSARMRNFSPIYGIPGQVNTGLKNLGNTCFMNAVLQCLADTSIFRRYFLQEKHMTDISRNSRLGSKGELADELGALIREIRSNQYKSVSPSNFKDAVGTHMPFFMGCEQQDAHEFLCMLLEKLHADLNTAPSANLSNGVFTLPDDLPPHIAMTKFWNHHISRNRSIVSDLFEGLLMSTLKCTSCGKQSHSFEVFTNLSLPIPTKLGHRFTLLDCLDLFSDEEKLYGEAAWECPTCKVKRDAIKQIKICKLPKVLVIHVKRFSYEGKWRQKLQNMVDFPLFDLRLKKYRSCSSLDNFDASYDLYGVVNHYGTLEGGHYVAYCKNDEKNKWFKYDDHEVTELSTADVKSHAAYLLFYTSKN